MRIYTLLTLLLTILFAQPAMADRTAPLAFSGSARSSMLAASDMTAGHMEYDTFDDDEEYETAYQPANDPIEGWNRFWFEFNDALYIKVLKPAHKGYSVVTPSELRTGVGNFFHNILYPVRFVNAVLQGKFSEAGVETSRFILNTMGGFGGLMNPAAHKKPLLAISEDPEDLGQTLGYWGAGDGFYIVWPVLGPSSLRDTAGLFGDSFLNPVSYVTPWHSSVSLKMYGEFNDFDDRLRQYEELKNSAIEPYTAVRNAYLQLREAKVNK